MRKLRLLGQGVWYIIRTRINNREPLFRRRAAVALFARVFRQAEGRYEFEVRALCLEDDWLTFYVKPADGFQLPEIMKWLKQVFAQRFNGMDGRIGHVWGDRYMSEILEGEPPEEGATGVRPLAGEPPEEGATGARPLAAEPQEKGATGGRPLAAEPQEKGATGGRPLAVEPQEEGTTGVRPLDEDEAETARFLLFFLPNPPLSPHTAAPRPG